MYSTSSLMLILYKVDSDLGGILEQNNLISFENYDILEENG